MSIEKLEIQRFPDKPETIYAVGLGLVDVVRARNFRSPEAGLYALNGVGFAGGKLLGQPDDPQVWSTSGPCTDETCDLVADSIEIELTEAKAGPSDAVQATIPWTLIIQLAMYVLEKFLKREAV